MPSYYYSSAAGSYTLTGAVTAATTTVVLNSVSGLPASTPYKVVLDPGTASEEIVKVTSVAATSLTVVRGWDSTSATSHEAGAVVRHMVTAEDFTLSRTHEDATEAHGATGAVVGTTNAQSLTNKDLSDPSNILPASVLTTTGTQSVANKDFSSSSNVFPGSLATLTTVQVLKNKDLTDGTNSFPASLARTSGQAFTGAVTAPNLPATSASVAGKRMHWSSTTANTTTGGVINITHALGWAPSSILVTPNVSGSVVCTSAIATNLTTIQFTFYFISTGQTVPAGSALTFSFLLLE